MVISQSLLSHKGLSTVWNIFWLDCLNSEKHREPPNPAGIAVNWVTQKDAASDNNSSG